MDSVGETLRGHLDTFGERLLQSLEEQLEKRDAAWEAQVKELSEENKRLRSELYIEHESVAAVGEASGSQTGQATGNAQEDGAFGSEIQRLRSSSTIESDCRRLADRFRDLDVDGAGSINVRSFQEKMMQVVAKDDVHLLGNLPSLVGSLRIQRPALFDGLQEDEISFPVFKELMWGKDVSWLGPEHVHTLNALRSTIVYEDAMVAVQAATAVRREELFGGVVKDRLWWLEPLVGSAIVVNAATIGLSLDIAPQAPAWKICEFVCTGCFVLELIVKLLVRGCLEYFVGSDWQWNLFDFLLVVLAVVEMGFTLYVQFTGEEHPGPLHLRDFTVLRITRLLRIARLGRVFKLRHLKELTLMATGIIGGLRTLFWSFVLLFVFVYILGIVSRHAVDDWKARTPCDDDRFSCNEVETIFYTHHNAMFGDLFRTCLTVFRCVSGDCNLPEGTPLAPMLLDIFGKLPMFWFLGCQLFVMVGVFNLIMAVFVENTLDYAKQDQEKLLHIRRHQQVQQAKRLQRLVDKLVRYTRRPSGSKQEHTGGLWKYIPNKGFRSMSDSSSRGYEVELPTPLKISRQAFDAAMADDEADDLLDYLEISLYNKTKLFDILDSDGDGVLSLHEIVDGIMRLRGPAEKSDVVSAGLMIRTTQKKVTEMRRSVDQIKGMLQSLQKGSPMGCTQSLPTHPFGQQGIRRSSRTESLTPARRSSCTHL